MSYIIKSSQPFTSVKLTEKGREKLAKGQLNYTTWSIGDSEINYNREIFVQDGIISGKTAVTLRPKDRQPNLKYFINTGSGSNSFPFGSGDVRCIKLTVNNEAEERGPFSGDTTNGFTTLRGEPNTSMSAYTRGSGILTSVAISGTSIDIAGNNAQVGDFLLLKINYVDFSNDTPQPHLFYKIQTTGTTLGLDRNLPYYSSVDIAYVIYKGGEISDNESDAIAYWDTGTLSFDSSCDVTTKDVPLWNMNIPFSEDVLGITGTTEYEKLKNYGSYNYIGQKNNYLYSGNNPDLKSIAVIHYSNKTISNLYGEFLFVESDTKKVKVHLPDLMYHRRDFGGSSSGDTMGMTFVTSGVTVSTGSNGLTYTPLVEDGTLVNGAPKMVGRVYTQLKIITFDDPEIVAAMSYKSNRNWTLPKLNLQLTNPSSGVGTGVLPAGKTMYVTYSLDNENPNQLADNGITPVLPCQNYSKIINTNTSSFDVQFNIQNVGLLPYMRSNGSSGGFYANRFKVIYQITDGGRPETGSWKEVDFTSSVDPTNTGYVQVTQLQQQNPNALTPPLQLTQSNTSSAPTYTITEDDELNMPSSAEPNLLQFGDERFFYGNIETFIGATIFKTIFKVAINASDFNRTTNTTRSSNLTTNPPNLKVSEVGIYDNTGDLVVIGKLSTPVELTPGKTVILELSIDF